MHATAKHKWDQHFGATTIILMDWTRIQTTAVAQSIKSFQIYANITNFPEHKLSSFQGCACAIQYIASTSTLYTFKIVQHQMSIFFLWYKLNKVLFCHNNCVMNVEQEFKGCFRFSKNWNYSMCNMSTKSLITIINNIHHNIMLLALLQSDYIYI